MKVSVVTCIVALFLLTSCRVETDEGSVWNDLSKLPFPEEQRERSQVIEDFDKDASAAVKKYKYLWQERGERRNNPGSRLDRVVLVTIAGELLLRDQANYGNYYSYIVENTNHSDTEVVVAALWALGHARDGVSRQLLFSFLKDARGEVSRAATQSLQYRYSVQTYEHRVDADREALLNMYEETCGSAKNEFEICAKGLSHGK